MNPLDLLEEAAASLRDRLAPTLSGEARYQALLTANAVETAGRALRARDARAEAEAALDAPAAAIRAGRHDGDAGMHMRLTRLARIDAWVADPAALSADDRRAVEALLA